MHSLRPKKGFTLIEIMIVVIVMGVIAGLALVRYNNIIRRAECRSAQQHLIKLHSLAQIDMIKGTYTPVYTGPHVILPTGKTLHINTPVMNPFRKTASLTYSDMIINCWIFFDQPIDPINPQCSQPTVCEAVIN